MSSDRAWIGNAADVPTRGGLRVSVGGVEIGVFRVGDEFLAIENACPHAGVPLHEGSVADAVVTCKAHGYRYDLRSGHCVDNPDGFPIPRFRVGVQDGRLWIAVAASEEGELRPIPQRRR